MEQIIKTNTLQARSAQKSSRLLKVPIRKRRGKHDTTIDPKDMNLEFDRKDGISFARAFHFSAQWREEAVFEFNQRQMVRDGYKPVPFHYFSDPKWMSVYGGGTNEYEEFLLKPLKNVKKYITAVYLNEDAYERLEASQIVALQSLNVPLYLFTPSTINTAHKKKVPIDLKKFTNHPANIENLSEIWMNMTPVLFQQLVGNGAMYDSYEYYDKKPNISKGMLIRIQKPRRGWTQSGFVFKPGNFMKELSQDDIIRNITEIFIQLDQIPKNSHAPVYLEKSLNYIKNKRYRIRIQFSEDYEKWKNEKTSEFVEKNSNSMTFFEVKGFIELVRKNKDLQWYGLYTNDATPTDKETYVTVIFDHNKLRTIKDLKIEDNPYNQKSADIVSKTKFYDLLPAIWYINVRNAAYMDPPTLSDFMNLIKFNPKIVIHNFDEIKKLHAHNEANKEDSFEQDINKIPETITIALGWISFRRVLKGSSKTVMLDKTTTGVDNLKKEQNTVFSFRLKDAVKDKVVSYNSKLKEVHIVNERKAKDYIKVVWLNPYLTKTPSFRENYTNILKNKILVINKKEIEDQMEAAKEEFAEEIEHLEEGRDAPLYHATNIEAFLEIISKDTMRGFTTQTLDNLVLDPKTKSRHRNNSYGSVINGISTTRQYQFAKRWADARYKSASVIIEFDQRKLAHNHKMVPIDFWETPGGGASDEFEEFVLGDIKYFGKYVNAIYLHKLKKPLSEYKLTKHIYDWAEDAGIPIKDLNTRKPMNEEAPTTNAGGGMIAGIGVGPKGEPGGKRSVMNFIRRKKKKSINNKKDET